MAHRIANSRVLAAVLLALAAVLPAFAQTVTVSNTAFPVTQQYQGTEQSVTLNLNGPVILQQIQIAPGYNYLDYSIQQNNCTMGASLPAGSSCTVQIAFSPHLPGWSSSPAPISRTAPLQILYIDQTLNIIGEISVPLTGTGQHAQGIVLPGLISDLIGNDVTRPSGFGGDGSAAANAVFTVPAGIAMDVLGNIYIADAGNGVIRLYYQAGFFPEISGTPVVGNVYTIAGIAPTGGVSHAGAGTDGVLATQSPLNNPIGLALDALGNLYISDSNNEAVRMVSATNGIITTVAGTLNAAEVPGTGFSGDLGPATQAQLYTPAQIAVDGNGNLYIADSGNNSIRVVYAAGMVLANLIATEIPGTTATPGDIYTIAGGPANAALPSNGDGGLAAIANLNSPQGVTVDALGDVYIADSTNAAVRRVDAVTGNISTVYSGSDTPVNLAIDASDSIYFTLQHSCTIQQYNPTGQANPATPVTTVVAGNGTCSASGDGGPSTAAGLSGAEAVVVDGAGNLYLLEADGVRVVNSTSAILAFGNQNVGTNTIGSVTVMDEDIQPYNNISYYSVEPEYFIFSPSYGTPFSAVPYVSTNPYVNDCNGALFGGINYGLNPGFTCVANFAFQPIADGGPFLATAYAYVNNGVNVALSGTGIGPLPTATLTGGPLNFNAVVNETTSPTQPLYLKNTSAVTLSLSTIYFSNFNFSETDLCGISTYATNPTLAPGATCEIDVKFATNTAGPVSGTIYVVDNASSGGGTQTATLNGMGLAPVGSLSVSTLSFPITLPGAVSYGMVTLTNTGNATLTLDTTGYSISGNDPGRFAITANTCGANLAIGANCKLTVSYSPLTYAYYSATLNIMDDTGGVRIYRSTTPPTYFWNTQTVGLIGPTGNPPVGTNLTVANASFPAAAVGVGESQTVNLTLTRAAAISSVAMTTGFTEYSIGAITGCVIDGVTVNAAGTICQLPITFTPAAPGVRSAPLMAIDLEGGTATPYSFALTGTGLGAVAALTPGIITTVVGGSHAGAPAIVGADGPAINAATGFTAGMALDSAGQIFLSDNTNEVIWKTDTGGNIHLYAGSPFPAGGYIEDLGGDGGTAIGARLGYVGPIALDARDGLYLGETDGYEDPARIRYIDPASGLITTAVGFLTPGSWAASTAFFYSTRIAVTVSGTKYLFVATGGGTSATAQPAWPTTQGASVVDGSVVWQNQGVYFGGKGCAAQTDSYGDGCLASQVTIGQVEGLVVDHGGNLFFSDLGGMVRRVDATSKIVTLIAGTPGTPGYAGDGGQATAAKVSPTDLAFDTIGNLYFLDSNGYVVRKITMATGVISTVAGAPTYTGKQDYCYGGGGYGGPASAALFADATGLAIDAANNIYVADNSGCVVSRIDAGTGIIHAIAGVPQSQAFYENPGYGDVGFGPYLSDGDATQATLNQPYLIRLDSTANLYIGSFYGGVRKVDTSQSVLNFTGWSYTQNGTPQQVDTVSGPQTATVLNAGNNGLLYFATPFLSTSSWGINNANFIRDVTNPTGATDCYSIAGLAVGFECPISVDFAPLSGSGYTLGTDTVNDNAVPGSGSQPIKLIGDVYGPAPAVTLTPLLLSFSTPQGGNSQPQPLTLNNQGSTALPITSITITGPGAAAFMPINDCGTSLAANTTCTIVVTFNPPVVGTTGTAVPPDILTATVSVNDSASNSPQQSQLTGTGTLPAVSGSSVENDLEGIHVTDTVSLVPATALTINETISLSDSVPPPAPSTILGINETIHLTDAEGGLAEAPVNILLTETIHVLDTDTSMLPVFIPIAETIHVVDTDTSMLPAFIAVAETIKVNDVPALGAFTNSDTTRLTASATAIMPGNTLMLTATVMPSNTTTPTGTVSFFDGSSLLGATGLSGGTATYSTSSLGLGAHTLHAVYSGDANFPATTSALLVVNVTSQNVLMVTPGNLSRNFATANPTLAYTITGFVGGDTSAVLTGAPALTTTASLSSMAGAYPITASVGTLTAPSKYVFSFGTGTLTVNGNAAQTITFAPIPNLPISTVKQISLTAHSSSGLPITYTVSGAASLSGTMLQLTGVGGVTVTASQAGNATFSPATSVPRSFQVTP